jgi:hypothetical protein
MQQQSLKKQEEPQPISTYKPRAIALAEQAKATRITDDVTRAMAIEIRSQLKICEKQLDSARLYHVKPLKEIIETRYEAPAREVKAIIKAGLTASDAEITRDHREQERKAEAARLAAAAEERRQRQEAERRAKEEADQRTREAAEKARQEAEEAGFTEAEQQEYAAAVKEDEAAKPIEVMAPAPVLPAIGPPAKTVRAESGAKATVRKIPDFEVTDLVALVSAWPAAVEVRRGYVLGLYSKGASVKGVRFFLRDSVSG